MSEGQGAPPFAWWGLGLLFLIAGWRWFERANIYFPSRAMTAHPGTYGLRYEELDLRASDGVRVHGWFVENESKSPVVLLSHGNAGNVSHRMEKLRLLRSAGASALLYDYRGYGRSSGSPSEQGTYRDGEAAYRWLVETRKVPPERIFLMGESLGCAVAVELALRHKAGGLILESGFTSTADMGRLIFPFLPVDKLIRFRYDSLAKLPLVSCPVLVMHSPHDDIVPFAMGRRLFDAARGPKTFFEMKGDHNEGFLDTGPAYSEAIRKFLGPSSFLK